MNIGDLFDSPLKVLIIAIVVLVLFGSRKMPDAARSLGRSMRILKSEVSKIHDDDEQPEPATQTQVQAQALTGSTQQAQIDALQQQIRDLQQQQPQTVGEAVANGAPVTEAPRTQQPG
jgi:sec-independent protein translocase protein TatA